MSVASSPSFPCIKLRSPPASSSSTSSSSSVPFRFTVRSSQADGPFRRPVAPAPVKPVPPSQSPSPSTSPPPPPKPAAVQDKNVITLEFQRQKAKELQEYFKQKKLEAADQGPFFGFIAKNEISNGRYIILYCFFCYIALELFEKITVKEFIQGSLQFVGKLNLGSGE